MEMELIKEYQTKEYLEAIEWGKQHPELMELNENPYDFFDHANWQRWGIAKHAQKLLGMSHEEQLRDYTAKRKLQDRMNS